MSAQNNKITHLLRSAEPSLFFFFKLVIKSFICGYAVAGLKRSNDLLLYLRLEIKVTVYFADSVMLSGMEL